MVTRPQGCGYLAAVVHLVGSLDAMRSAVGAAVLLGMLALSGCVEGDPLPTLPPTPSATPIFASEEEALAAAEEAYAAYSEVSDLIANDGGVDPERIAPFVTDEQLQNELDTAAYYRDHGIHSVGSVTVIKTVLQQANESVGTVEVAVYVCLDVESVRVLDNSGNDVTPSDRDPITALEVVLQGDAADSLLVASSDLWSDSSFCLS